MAKDLDLVYWELPSSPCLSSRLYTGTRVTPERLAFIAWAEDLIKKRTGIPVLRVRIDDNLVLVELEGKSHLRNFKNIEEKLLEGAVRWSLGILKVELDPRGYKSGQSFVDN